MCLITRFPKIITKKDLVVYKILEKDLTSPYLKYRYALNSLVISDLKVSDVALINGGISTDYARYILPYEIWRSGIHYSKFNTYVQDLNLHLQVIENGLHSLRTWTDAIEYRNSLFFGYPVQIYRAIVPAGSALYINYRQIVSNQLIIKNIVEL